MKKYLKPVYALFLLPDFAVIKPSPALPSTVFPFILSPGGKGYMRKLMHMAIQDMKKNNISMSTLSGLRNRYQYYGYEKGGITFQYCFTSDNFRHCRERFPKRDINLCLIQNKKMSFIG